MSPPNSAKLAANRANRINFASSTTALVNWRYSTRTTYIEQVLFIHYIYGRAEWLTSDLDKNVSISIMIGGSSESFLIEAIAWLLHLKGVRVITTELPGGSIMRLSSAMAGRSWSKFLRMWVELMRRESEWDTIERNDSRILMCSLASQLNGGVCN